MAESSKRINPKLKLKTSDIPWHDISDFRNKLVHDYLDIDLEIIWAILKTDLPKLKKKVGQILRFLNKKNFKDIASTGNRNINQ